MNSALIMALPQESQQLFEQANIPVHYCGIGKINAAFTTYDVIQKTGCDTVINLGSAGSHVFNTHELVEVSRFVQRDMDVSALGFEPGVTPMDDEALQAALDLTPYFSHLPHGICGTGDSFATHRPPVSCQLMDMEGYAIAKVCKKLNVRCISIKYISDGADHHAHLDWQENLYLGAKKLLQIYQQIIGG